MIALLPKTMSQEPCPSDLEASNANLKGLESIDVSRFLSELFGIPNTTKRRHSIEKPSELRPLVLCKTVDELLGGTLAASQHNVFHGAPITALRKSSFGQSSHFSLALSKQIWKRSAREENEPE